MCYLLGGYIEVRIDMFAVEMGMKNIKQSLENSFLSSSVSILIFCMCVTQEFRLTLSFIIDRSNNS